MILVVSRCSTVLSLSLSLIPATIGYASDPAAQARVRKEVAEGRTEISRLMDQKQKLEKTAVALGATGAGASDDAARQAEIEAKYHQVRSDLKSKLVSRRALVKMVQVYVLCESCCHCCVICFASYV